MNKSTYEAELERTGQLIYTTVGTSMRPFIRSQEDLVVIQRRPDTRYGKWDAVLYRRDSGQYVLHRIVKVGPRATPCAATTGPIWSTGSGMTRSWVC